MRTRSFLSVFATIILFSIKCYSQSKESVSFTPAIEDNSMFIEEAYNQENGVVQHISNFVFIPNLKDNFYYAFTQEWPAFGLKHQLSYTLQYNSNARGDVTGFSDVLINYRYQLSYKDKYIVCAPRFSIIIPTGNQDKGLGNGSWGMQVNLPLSKRWTNHFINHFNIGATYLFKVKDVERDFNKPLVSYFAGISTIWLISEKFNFMVEFITNRTANPGLNNDVTYTNQTILAPGIRYAININKLQILPGLSVPFTFTKNSKTETGVFIYLSFEHEF